MVRGPVQRISANGSGRSRVKEQLLDYPVPSVPTLLGMGIDAEAVKPELSTFKEKPTFQKRNGF